MDSRTWKEALDIARLKAEQATKRVMPRNTYGKIVAYISFGPKGPGKVSVEIVEKFPET